MRWATMFSKITINKRLLILFLLWVTPLMAREKYQNWCAQGGEQVTTQGLNSTTRVMRSFPQCTVSVFYAGTRNLAPHYADDQGTTLGNPFGNQNRDTGQYFFYADNGRYD